MNKEDIMNAGEMQQGAIPMEIVPPSANMPVTNNMPQQISSDAEYQSQNIPNQLINQNPASAQQLNPQYVNSIKQMAAEEIIKIQNLIRAGQINPSQGQNLMSYVVSQAFEKVKQNYQQSGLTNEAQFVQSPSPQVQQPIIEDTEFFNIEGRSDVLDYLKKNGSAIDKDEISHISNMVEKIEKAAIERYLRKQDHEKTLNDENEAAKSRLRANAQNSVNAENRNVVFTREQIGKMSGAEFAKNERMIMDQLKKGLIR